MNTIIETTATGSKFARIERLTFAPLIGKQGFVAEALPEIDGTSFRNWQWRPIGSVKESIKEYFGLEVRLETFRPQNFRPNDRKFAFVKHYYRQNGRPGHGILHVGSFDECPINMEDPLFEIMVPRGWVARVMRRVRMNIVAFDGLGRAILSNGDRGIFEIQTVRHSFALTE